ncbi:preprotein translocase subunit SecG [Candidatus Coxiella mudrowiae]|uniref:Protein-export membrane protein SecG n=1 Tax=Candidatus Coxiella mudrowiae TaxID=2054173 RepID=A0ABN4HVA0_9COXI|nr:preprotein translocase subunit SecG [Candidatus Coxiella mudrowiae]AKQ33323.1 Protein translocase subunit [Candidatus Coxiella mudrowiae]
MQSTILIIHVLISVCLIGLVLLQHGKGADAGPAFGSGASNTMFGSTGATPFLMKVTIILAVGFFATSIGFGYLASRNPGEGIKVPPLQTHSAA